MIVRLIAVMIVGIAFLCDESGIRKKTKKGDAVADRRIELYKTLSYVLIACFWGFLKLVRIWVPLLLLVNMLAYFRCLFHPVLIGIMSQNKKKFPTVGKMFLISGGNLGIFMIINTTLYNTRLAILLASVTAVLFLPFLVCGCIGKANGGFLAAFLVPILFFAAGSIFSVNSFYGVKTVGKADSIVSDIHITMRADSFSIPKEDAIDGKTSFVGNRQIGDSVHIVEREGCLGLRWFTVS